MDVITLIMITLVASVQATDALSIRLKDAREAMIRLQQTVNLSLPLSSDKRELQREAITDNLVPQKWEDSASHHCHTLMMELAVQGGNFIHCLIHNARPFRVCKTCVKHYTRFTTLYSKLQQNDTCSGMLLKADRIQVITSVYTVVTSTWSTAFCDLCFDSVEENFTTGQVTFNYTADTILFEEMEEHLSTCISNYSHTVDPTDNMTEVCRECRPIYRQMTSHFSAVKKRTKGCVCQDIVDMMNSTWFMWGTRFRCPRPQVSASSVIVISSVFVIITILLYSMSKAVTKIPRPQILKPKRMKRCQQRWYGAISLTGDSEECPLVAAAQIQGVYRQRNH